MNRFWNILCLLVLGAIVNVLVAWVAPITLGIASTSIGNGDDPDEFDVVMAAHESPWVQSLKKSHKLHLYAAAGVWNGFATVLTIDAQDLASPEPHPFVGVQILRSGWPLHSLEGRRIAYLNTTDNQGVIQRVETTMAISLPSRRVYSNSADILPLKMLIVGFAINSLVFATALFMIRYCWVGTRRIARQRRGRCQICAYDLRGKDHDICPECGTSRFTKSTDDPMRA